MMTGQEPMIAPSASACSGPAPPKATRANSLGSYPCWTDTSRSAPTMFSLTMSMIPAAASSIGRPIAVATCPTAARAASASRVISPPSSAGGR
jgi:hypothetical protein